MLTYLFPIFTTRLGLSIIAGFSANSWYVMICSMNLSTTKEERGTLIKDSRWKGQWQWWAMTCGSKSWYGRMDCYQANREYTLVRLYWLRITFYPEFKYKVHFWLHYLWVLVYLWIFQHFLWGLHTEKEWHQGGHSLSQKDTLSRCQLLHCPPTVETVNQSASQSPSSA